MKKIVYLGVIIGLMVSCAMQTELARRQGYLADHPTIDPKVRDAILAGKLCMGMTEDEVVASIGAPDRINRDTYQFGTRT